MTLTPLRPGDPATLGRFHLLARIGAGGMGAVYLARDPAGARAAVKVIRPDLAADQEFRARFSNEVRRARQVPSFCTAAVLDADPDGSNPWMAVEYVDGPSLEAVVRERGPLGENTLQSVAVGVATALVSIHGAGVVHRDLKPANVLLAPGSPKVIDFGISKGTDTAGDLTRTDHLVGTIAYMAPERFDPAGRLPISPAADVFAWGVLVAFAASGRTPFAADSPLAVAGSILTQPPDLSGLTGGLRELVESALAKDPAQRPTAAAVLEALLRGGEPTARMARQENPSLFRDALDVSAAAARRRRRHTAQRRATAAAAALLLVGASVAVSVHFGRAAQAAAQESRRQATASTVQALVTRARQTLKSDPGLSLRLAMSAHTASASNETRAAVTAGLATRFRGELGTTQPTWRASYSPDGTVIATVGVYGSGDLWRAAPDGTTAHAAPLPLGGEETNAAAFSPDGKLLATLGKRLRLWSVAAPGQPRLLKTLTATSEQMSELILCFTRDGQGLVAGGSGTVALWDVTDPRGPRRVWTLPGRNSTYSQDGFDPVRGIFVAVNGDGDAQVWRAEGHRPPRHVADLNAVDVPMIVAFRRDGRIMAATEYQGTRLYDVTGSRPRLLSTVGNSAAAGAVAFDRSGKRLAVGSGTETTVWDVSRPATPVRLAGFGNHSGDVTSVGFTPDGRTLLTTGLGTAHTAMTWRVEGIFRPTFRKTLTRAADTGRIEAEIAPDDVISLGEEGTVRTWRNAGAERPAVQTVATRVDPLVFSVRLRVAGPRHLLYGGLLFDVSDRTRPRLMRPAGATKYFQFLDVNPESGLAASGVGRWGAITLYRLSGSRPPEQVSAAIPSGQTIDVRFVRGTSLLIVSDPRVGNDNAVVVWDIADPVRPRRLDAVTLPDAASVLTYSTDGRKIAFQTRRDVRVWRPGSGRDPVIVPLPESDGGTRSLSLSTDGSLLAAGTSMGTQLWSVIDDSPPALLGLMAGQEQEAVLGTREPVLLTTDFEAVRLWDVRGLLTTNNNPMPEACRLSPGLGRDMWTVHLPKVPYRAACPA